MARPRKNAPKPNTQELSLVPVEEQPYPLPEGWKWYFLEGIAGIKRGASPRPIKAFITEDRNGINWIKIGDTDNGKYVTTIKEKITPEGAKKSVFVSEGTLLLSNSMSFGRPYILNTSGCIHDGWLAINPSKEVTKDFLYYALLSSDWYFEKVAVGTAVRNLNSDRVAGTPIPLPPLDEQERIVTRIESLFAKLDEAKEKAEAVLDSYETRKAAILHKAFTGELTAKWREERGIEKTNTYVKIKEVLSDIKYGTSEKSDYSYSGLPVIRIPNIADGSVDLSDLKFLTSSALPDYDLVEPGDILMIRSNGSRELVGKCALIDETSTGKAYASFLIRLRPKTNVSAKFLLAFLNSSDARSQLFAKAKSSAGINNINSKEIGAVDIWLPHEEEQQEITRILDSLLEKEQQSKEAAENVLEQIDLMKKAILAKAFRGELG